MDKRIKTETKKLEKQHADKS